MHSPLPRQIRAHERRLVVVLATVAAVLCSLARPTGASAAPVDPVPAGVWPLQPEPQVVRAFDPPDSPYGSGHRGVDLAGAVGQVVHTALAGRVTYATTLAGRGVVVVDHGRTRTTYEPVTATVRVGDVLARGQPIGTLALAGSHCFPAACLHWGWKRGDTYLDPLLLVGGGPVVLLPLWRDTPVAARAATPALPYAALVQHLLASTVGRQSPLRTSLATAPAGLPAPRGRRPPARRPPATRPLAMRPLLM